MRRPWVRAAIIGAGCVVALCLGAFVLLLGSQYLWRPIYVSKAVDGSTQVQVDTRNCFADCEVRVLVGRGWAGKVLAQRQDCNVLLAHAAWEGSRVAVFVSAAYCDPIFVAYDTRTGQELDFGRMEPVLRRSIVETYRLTPQSLSGHGGDVFRWADQQGSFLHRPPGPGAR